jgi:hypothetical protein
MGMVARDHASKVIDIKESSFEKDRFFGVPQIAAAS